MGIIGGSYRRIAGNPMTSVLHRGTCWSWNDPLSLLLPPRSSHHRKHFSSFGCWQTIKGKIIQNGITYHASSNILNSCCVGVNLGVYHSGRCTVVYFRVCWGGGGGWADRKGRRMGCGDQRELSVFHYNVHGKRIYIYTSRTFKFDLLCTRKFWSRKNVMTTTSTPYLPPYAFTHILSYLWLSKK